MKFTLKLSNEFDDALNDVIVKTYILDDSTNIGEFDAGVGSLRQSSDDEGSHILWEIEEIEAGNTVEASCIMKVIHSMTIHTGGLSSCFRSNQTNRMTLRICRILQYFSCEVQEDIIQGWFCYPHR